jgi:hypothetical protein
MKEQSNYKPSYNTFFKKKKGGGAEETQTNQKADHILKWLWGIVKMPQYAIYHSGQNVTLWNQIQGMAVCYLHQTHIKQKRDKTSPIIGDGWWNSHWQWHECVGVLQDETTTKNKSCSQSVNYERGDKHTSSVPTAAPEGNYVAEKNPWFNTHITYRLYS